MRLPALSGSPIRVEIRTALGAHHAATSIRRRLILLDAGVLRTPGEFERILIHELFHFVWVRLSNSRRKEWEAQLASEYRARTRGELGWSAEWRKGKLSRSDVRFRTLRWRHYVCESFCDTAAWLYSGLKQHEEFTLVSRARRARRGWFREQFPQGQRLMV